MENFNFYAVTRAKNSKNLSPNFVKYILLLSSYNVSFLQKLTDTNLVQAWYPISLQNFRKILWVDLINKYATVRPTVYRSIYAQWKIRSISPYSVQMRENTDRNNSENGHLPSSGWVTYRFWYSIRHNDTKNKTPPSLVICVISRFLAMHISF